MYGAKMRELRTAQKLGLRELAKRTLIDYTTLSRIENDLKAVTLSQAVVIAKALGCRVEDMLQEEGSMKIDGITTIDSEIFFGECCIQEVPEEIKKLFPEQNLIKVSEKGKSYILNSDYIVLLFTSL